MNKIAIGLVLAAGTMFAQPVFAQQTQKKKSAAEVQLEDVKKISSFIKNKVNIKESATLTEIANQYGSMEEYQRRTSNDFMSVNSYQKFVESLYKMDPVEKIILNDTMGLTQPKDFKSLWKGRKFETDVYSDQGEVTGTKTIIPDVTPEQVSSIIFYEEWKTDPLTLEMSKRVLAYSVVFKDALPDGVPFDKVLFTIVKDDAALQKLKDNFRGFKN